MLHLATFGWLGPVPHLLQALHPLQVLQAPQPAQLPPQERFPAFLSRIMLRIRSPTISIMTAMSTILIRLADSHANIGSLPFGEGWQRCGREQQNLTALPEKNIWWEKKERGYYFTVSF
jgi:hypothetical protein